MGFTSGCTGGITLTLSLAYLFAYTHQSSRVSQSNILRASTHALNSALSPVPPPPPPNRRQVAAIERQTITERFKDWWNGEIEGAVRSAQRTDWDSLRDGVEGKVMSLVKGAEWKPEFSPEAWAQAAKAKAEAAIGHHEPQKGLFSLPRKEEDAGNVAKKAGHGLAAQAREAYTTARAKAGAVADHAREGVETAKHQVEEATAMAKAKVHMAEEKWEAKVDNKILHMSDVEKVMQQRYDEKRVDNAMGKSVDEALEQRLKASGKGGGPELKGI